MAFARGAIKSPRHKLLAARPHAVVHAPPPAFAIVPPKLSFWDNERDGVCVSSEEAFAKAAWSVYCGLPEVFASEAEVRSFAAQHGWLNGASLTEVMDVMKTKGMSIGGVTYKDGDYQGVDYTNALVLQSAISTGPVKIAIDANALPGGAGNQSGWHVFGKGNYPNTDHCVGLCGYGTAAFCFGKLGVPVPAGVDPNKPDCYLLFTWNTIGVVDLPWLAGTCTEAWVRNPTTPGQTPTPVPPVPVPPVPPVPPTPTPNPAWLQWLVDLLLKLFGNQPRSVIACNPSAFAAGAFGLTGDPAAIDWTSLIAYLKAVLKQYGPEIVPVLDAWIDALPVGPVVKLILKGLVTSLLNQLQGCGQTTAPAGPFIDFIKTAIAALVAKAPALVSVVVADLAAGKSWPAILADLLAALAMHKAA